MILGPTNFLSCPYCGGEKGVLTLQSGNTFGGTVWSDTRRIYPMLPEVSPIQECPHCGRYYFIEQAKSRYDYGNGGGGDKLGKLTFHQLADAKREMEGLSLTKEQRWILNHQLFMAYNDMFRRDAKMSDYSTEKAKAIYRQTIEELLEGIDRTDDYALFHAELLRESGRFEEARAVLEAHGVEEDRWVVEAMMRHIEAGDTSPFLLIEEGVRVG